ncbi:Sec-independent protein translocase protein TatB [Marinospirillum alkaliphilum]|uniref:Sec-independent protein translocase protein TatB n=1 Tax=Marinospirillum alkaliphilum DSM 21637 TaxID=1122209 RepID=A0A1K1W869_9GAMM|nr:Sec-independent protein translocase protein TatB [Marinospirillum alkaliphilum]SFX33578.1 sec-independent protein translocase protein TatB [Marinospirillum alkaliphilum DSM 21637]
MFDIGFFELLLIGIVGLLVLGPERLPQAVRTLGLYIGRIRKAVSGIQQEVNEQLQLEEMRQRLAEHERKVRAGLLDVEKEVENQVNMESGADAQQPVEPVKEQAETPVSRSEDKPS